MYTNLEIGIRIVAVKLLKSINIAVLKSTINNS